MTLEIDTVNKIIRIPRQVNLGELIKTLSDLFPDGAWKEFHLQPDNYPRQQPFTIQPSISPVLQPTWIGPGTSQPYMYTGQQTKFNIGDNDLNQLSMFNAKAQSEDEHKP